MSTLYILQNQDGYYLKKNTADGNLWADGREANLLFATPHKDEAVNMLFEVNSQHVDLRLTVKEYSMSTKKHPVIPESELPPPLVNEITEIAAGA